MPSCGKLICGTRSLARSRSSQFTLSVCLSARLPACLTVSPQCTSHARLGRAVGLSVAFTPRDVAQAMLLPPHDFMISFEDLTWRGIVRFYSTAKVQLDSLTLVPWSAMRTGRWSAGGGRKEGDRSALPPPSRSL